MSEPEFIIPNDGPRALTEAQRAWLAGLLEGEGTFSLTYLKLAVSSKDADVIETLFTMTGVGCFTLDRKSRQNPKWSDAYIWRVNRRTHVLYIIEQIMPYMHKRRRARLEDMVWEAKQREEYWRWRPEV